MIFTTYRFLAFLIIVLTIYRTLNHFKLQSASKIWLVLASFYFYSQGAKEFLLFFMGSVFFNYFLGSALILTEGPSKKKFLFALGLAENLGLLGYFKYANFFVENYNMLTGSELSIGAIILPIGISFFTFQLIAYLVDCYRGETRKCSLLDYLLFITFFPQLIVGPIVHHKEMVPQFESKSQSKFNKENFFLGLFIFSIGCAKKVLLADPLTNYAKPFFANVSEYGLLDAWLSTFSYTFSYYFDLSGYADMALGMGRFFNVKLPENFNSPYKARNFREYWRRWHMTLSRFLSNYVFRSVYKKGAGSFGFYFAVMTTFFVSGFWHGAGWHFVLWGIINGIFVCMAHFMRGREWALPYSVAWPLTFAGILGTRVLFVSGGLRNAIAVYKKLLDFSVFLDVGQACYLITRFASYNAYTIFILIIAMAITFFVRNTSEFTRDFLLQDKHAVIIAILLVLSFIQMTVVSDFLYFQF